MTLKRNGIGMPMANITSLALAVRLPVVLHYVGELMVGIALMVGVSAAVGWWVADTAFAGRATLVFLLVSALAIAWRHQPAATDLQVNESLLVTTLVFLVGCAAMVWPLMSAGLGFMDAVFESVSGLTTTGLTTVANVETRGPAFLFARAWMQWCGGLVIVVLALGLVIEPGPAARRLYGTDTGAVGTVEGTRIRARHALVVYSGLLLAGVLLLIAWGASPFDALVHSLAAVSTGGFSSHNNSIAGLANGWAGSGVLLLTLFGAVPLAAWPGHWRGQWHRLVRDAEVRALLVLASVISLVMILLLRFCEGLGWNDAVTMGPMLAISAQTTSGFEAMPVSGLGPATLWLLMVAMFVGGGAGSTAGGVKILRLLLLLRLVRHVFQRTRVPRHAVLDVDMANSIFEPREAFGMLVLVALFIGVIALSWFVFLALGYAPMASLFEVVSAVGTVGMSSGITSQGLAGLPKLVLCMDMLMGRLEIIAVLLLFYPGTWFGKRGEGV